MQDIEDETLEFRPEWALPEIGVYGNCEGEANQSAQKTGGEDVAERV